MNRLQQALAVLFGNVPKVTFGLEKATVIFKAARGRYDGDQSKAVPFAILETARAMGAEITVFEEAKAEKLGIASDIKQTEEIAAANKQQQETLIKQLEAKKKAAEATIQTTARSAESHVAALKKEEDGIDEVVGFFATQ